MDGSWLAAEVGRHRGLGWHKRRWRSRCGRGQFDPNRGPALSYLDTNLGTAINGIAPWSFAGTGLDRKWRLRGCGHGHPPVIGFSSDDNNSVGFVLRANGNYSCLASAICEKRSHRICRRRGREPSVAFYYTDHIFNGGQGRRRSAAPQRHHGLRHGRGGRAALHRDGAARGRDAQRVSSKRAASSRSSASST